MNLKQLQAEWRAKWSQSSNGLGAAVGLQCADALAPHILQQERDMDLIREIAEQLELDNKDNFYQQFIDKARSRLKEMKGDGWIRFLVMGINP